MLAHISIRDLMEKIEKTKFNKEQIPFMVYDKNPDTIHSNLNEGEIPEIHIELVMIERSKLKEFFENNVYYSTTNGMLSFIPKNVY